MKRLTVVALAICSCLALAGCGTAVPDVKGKTVAKAQEALARAGFHVSKVTYDERLTDATGSVVAQAPESGTTAKEGSGVALTVEGPRPVPTPALLDLDEAKAEAVLGSVGLALGVAGEAYDASVTAGLVASQTPAPGVDAARGSSVAIVISKGLEPVNVPRVVGRAKADATALLKAAGFKVKAATKDNKAKKGAVIAQKPGSGTAQPGTTVRITVSTGVELVTVPDLYQIMYQVPGLDIFTRYSTIEAFINRRIASKGLKVHVVTGDDTVSGPQQHPRKGSRVPRGTTITLGVLD